MLSKSYKQGILFVHNCIEQNDIFTTKYSASDVLALFYKSGKFLMNRLLCVCLSLIWQPNSILRGGKNLGAKTMI